MCIFLSSFWSLQAVNEDKANAEKFKSEARLSSSSYKSDGETELHNYSSDANAASTSFESHNLNPYNKKNQISQEANKDPTHNGSQTSSTNIMNYNNAEIVSPYNNSVSISYIVNSTYLPVATDFFTTWIVCAL